MTKEWEDCAAELARLKAKLERMTEEVRVARRLFAVQKLEPSCFAQIHRNYKDAKEEYLRLMATTFV